ncbi:SDR family oxidoreductase [Alloalcanivorax sp. C16-2]|uniref:SDR family oxidoreductase n=1 Tax=Alloalcanivorax sp. C16-2 TaxID=3390052 RepID=UPI0039708557
MAMLTDKVALVTGAGAGIGRATALKFAEEGARVVVADLNVAGGEETVALIKKQGGEALFTRADVTDAAAVDALIRTAVDSFGRLDCACNNAGIEGAVVPFTDQSEDDYEAVMRVNAKGTFLCLRAEIRQMLQNGGGAIVNLASIAGLIGFTGLAPYVASKHAVNGLTKNAALEFGKQGIRVNSVCPGGIDTRMLDSLADQASGGAQSSRDMMEPLHPIGRIGTPEEVAELIVWLCSPRASFVTGANIPVDGGYVAQ